MTARLCRLVQLRPEHADEYLRLHEAVWPEVEQRLRRSNITNFSIFRRGEVLVSYLEYAGSDFDADMRALGDDEVSRRWSALTGIWHLAEA